MSRVVPSRKPRLDSNPRAFSVQAWLDYSSLLWSLALLALFAQFVLYAAHAAVVLPYPFDLDQGEGYDVNAGWLLAQSLPIYTDNERYPYFSSNYPPVYSLAVAGATLIWGPTPLAGRAVSLAASLGLGLLIFLAARGQGSNLAGLVGTGAFWLSNYVYHVTPLARVNALAALLALAGLLCIIRPGRRWVAFGTMLLLGALYTKPTTVDATAAGLVYLWLVNRRRALSVAASLAGIGILLALGLEAATARAFSLNVVFGNLNPFVPGQVQEYFWNFGLLHGAPLGLAGYGTARALAIRRPDVMHLFFLAGMAMALGVGKWGAGESYFLSAIVATCILAGRVADQALRARGFWSALVPALLLVQNAISAHGALSSWLPGLPDRGLQAAALGREPTRADLERGYGIVSRLKETPDPDLVEDPSFELTAGKPVVGNATHLRNLFEATLWRSEALVADLEARRYHTVVLDAEQYPEPVLSAVGRRYFLFDTVNVYGATQKVFLPGAS